MTTLIVIGSRFLVRGSRLWVLSVFGSRALVLLADPQDGRRPFKVAGALYSVPGLRSAVSSVTRR
jgi:hypothetical protein